MKSLFAQVQDELLEHFDYGELDTLLEPHVRGGIKTIVDPRDRWPHQVTEVVRHAQRHQYFIELVDDAAEQRPSSALRRIARELHEDRDRLNDPQLFKTLRQTLDEAEISDDVLLGAYRMFVQPGFQFVIDETSITNVRRAVIETLINFVDGQRLLLVLLYLANVKQGTVAQTNIRSWISHAQEVRYHEFDIAKAQKTVEETIRRYRRVRLHLVIALRPRSDGYEVSAWRQLIYLGNQEIGPMVPIEDPRACSEEELAAFVAHLIRRMETERKFLGPVAHRFVVELFLPLRFLAHPVDQLSITLDPMPPFTLGIRHSVIVRSWERAFDARYEILWNDWKYFWELQRTEAGCAVCCTEAHFAAGYSDFVHAHDACAVTLTFVPEEKQWREIVTTGTPIAFWMRKEESICASLMTFVTEISGVEHASQIAVLADAATISWRPVRDWRPLVDDHRGRLKEPHAREMTLLWDDPDENRRPPIGGLVTP